MATTIPTEWGDATVRVSVGVAFASAATSPEAAVTAADHAMYRAKQAGGNRWLAADP